MWYNEVTKLAVPVSALTPTGTSPKPTHWRCVTMSNSIVPQQKRHILTKDDYILMASYRGITWLGPFPRTSRDKTEWKCAQGHVWSTSLHNLRGCNRCSYVERGDNLRHSPDEYHALAAKFGVEWIGPEVKRNTDKTWWRCPNGHVWQFQYGSFRGCTTCNYPNRAAKRRNTTDDYHALAAERGFVWLGPEVISTNRKTKWRCQHGHIWETSYNVIRGGCGCRICSISARNENVRNKDDAYSIVAQERGFVWLGPSVKSSKHSTQWQCQNGHVWVATYNNISKGSGCPQCLGYVNGVRASKVQLQLCAMLDGTANYKVGRLSIDVALVEKMIAVEYDCNYWHNRTDALRRDARKNQRLIDSGWKVLRVKAQSMLPTREQLDDALMSLMNGCTYQEIVLEDWRG